MSDGQPENLVLHLLREIRGEMATAAELAATKAELRSEMADLRSEMGSLRADVASDIHTLDAKIDATRKDLSEQIVGLRRAVIDYHSSVIGHGTLISDLEARLRRVEQRLGLEGH
jgi:signal transduction histidine kinase